MPVLCDLEQDDPAPHLGTADAIVFAAGAGPGSGAERKRTVDYGGAVKLIEAAEALGVRRYLMVSSMGAGDPESASEQMRPYQQAKHDADEALAGSDLDWTIVRPGRLTNAPGSGEVDLAPRLGRYGEVTREDVASVLLAMLEAENTVRGTYELLGGDVPVAEAVSAQASSERRQRLPAPARHRAAVGEQQRLELELVGEPRVGGAQAGLHALGVVAEQVVGHEAERIALVPAHDAVGARERARRVRDVQRALVRADRADLLHDDPGRDLVAGAEALDGRAALELVQPVLVAVDAAPERLDERGGLAVVVTDREQDPLGLAERRDRLDAPGRQHRIDQRPRGRHVGGVDGHADAVVLRVPHVHAWDDLFHGRHCSRGGGGAARRVAGADPARAARRQGAVRRELGALRRGVALPALPRRQGRPDRARARLLHRGRPRRPRGDRRARRGERRGRRRRPLRPPGRAARGRRGGRLGGRRVAGPRPRRRAAAAPDRPRARARRRALPGQPVRVQPQHARAVRGGRRGPGARAGHGPDRDRRRAPLRPRARPRRRAPGGGQGPRRLRP